MLLFGTNILAAGLPNDASTIGGLLKAFGQESERPPTTMNILADDVYEDVTNKTLYKISPEKFEIVDITEPPKLSDLFDKDDYKIPVFEECKKESPNLGDWDNNGYVGYGFIEEKDFPTIPEYHLAEVRVNGVPVSQIGYIKTVLNEELYFYSVKSDDDSDVSYTVLEDGDKFDVCYLLNEFEVSYKMDDEEKFKALDITLDTVIPTRTTQTTNHMGSFEIEVPDGYIARIWREVIDPETQEIGRVEVTGTHEDDGIKTYNNGYPLGADPVYKREGNEIMPDLTEGPETLLLHETFYDINVQAPRTIVVTLEEKEPPVLVTNLFPDLVYFSGRVCYGKSTAERSEKDGNIISPDNKWNLDGLKGDPFAMNESGDGTYEYSFVLQTNSGDIYLMDSFEVNGTAVKVPFVPQTLGSEINEGMYLPAKNKGIASAADDTPDHSKSSITTELEDGTRVTITYVRAFGDTSRIQSVYEIKFTNVINNVTITGGNIMQFDSGAAEYIIYTLDGVALTQDTQKPFIQHYNHKAETWGSYILSKPMVVDQDDPVTTYPEDNNGRPPVGMNNFFNVRFQLAQGYDSPTYEFVNHEGDVYNEQEAKGEVIPLDQLEPGAMPETTAIYGPDAEGWYYISIQKKPSKNPFPENKFILLNIRAVPTNYAVRYLRDNESQSNLPKANAANVDNYPSFFDVAGKPDYDLALNHYYGFGPTNYSVISIDGRTPIDNTAPPDNWIFKYWEIVNDKDQPFPDNEAPKVYPNLPLDLEYVTKFAQPAQINLEDNTTRKLNVIRLMPFWEETPEIFTYEVYIVKTDKDGVTHEPELIQTVESLQKVLNETKLVALDPTAGVFRDFLRDHPNYAFNSELNQSSSEPLRGCKAWGNNLYTVVDGGQIYVYVIENAAQMKIEKLVEGYNLSAEDKTREFDFKLEFFTDPEMTVKPEDTALLNNLDENLRSLYDEGALKFKLRHGESLELKNIPQNLYYRVSEILDDDAPFKVVPESKSYEGQFPGEFESVTRRFVNKRTTGNLVITKRVTGSEEIDQDFNFNLVLSKGNSDAPLEGLYKVITKSNTETLNEEYVRGLQLSNYAFDLKDEQSLTVVGLPIGTEYSIVEDSNLFETQITVVGEGTSKSETGKAISGTLSGSGLDNLTSVLFENKGEGKNNPELGTLTIKKTIVNEDGSEVTSNQKNTVFNVNVKLTPPVGGQLDNSYPITIEDGETGSYSRSLIELQANDGTYNSVLQIKYNQTIRIDGLPVGTKYYVIEDSDEDYYILNSQTGTINSDNTAFTGFVNVKKDLTFQNRNILVVSKNVIGNTDQEDFIFELTFENSEESNFDTLSYIKENGESGTLEKKDGKFEFTLKDSEIITFIRLSAGLKWKIEETDVSISDVSIVGSVGPLEGTTIYQSVIEEDKLNYASYTNKYSNRLEDTGAVSISKTVSSGTTDDRFIFEIELTPQEGMALAKFYPYYGNQRGYIELAPVKEESDEEGSNEEESSDENPSSYKGSLILGDGESITIYDLPRGTAFKVKEVELENSLFANLEDDYVTIPSGNREIEGSIGDKLSETFFVNARIDSFYRNSLIINKKVIGVDFNPDHEFEFSLNFKNAAGSLLGNSFLISIDGDTDIVSSGHKFKLKAGHSATILDIPVDSIWTVTETQEKGYVSTVEDKVTNTASGTIDLEEGAAVTFVNYVEQKNLVTDNPNPDFNITYDNNNNVTTSGMTPDKQIVYEIHWSNFSTETQNIVIEDKLDPNVEFIEATQPGILLEDGETVRWELGPKEPQSYGSVRVTVKVKAELFENANKVTNSADIVIGNDSTVETNEVTTPIVEPLKSIISAVSQNGESKTEEEILGKYEVGDQVTYSISWKNYKTEDATIVITDTLDQNLQLLATEDFTGTYDKDSRLLTWILKDIEPDKSGTVSFTAEIIEPDETYEGERENIDNQASVKVAGDPAIDTNIVRITKWKPEKTIENESSDGLIRPGDEVTYKITWKNYSLDTETITIKDILNDDLIYVSSSDDGKYDEATHTIIWTLEDKTSGAEGSVTVTVQVPEEFNGSLENTAGVTVGHYSEIKSDKKTNPVWKPVKRATPEAGSFVSSNQVITYEITWKNYTDDNAVITVTDVLDEKVEYQSSTEGGILGPDGRTVTWNLGERSANALGTVSLSVAVKNLDNFPGMESISNQAVVKVNETELETNVVKHITQADKKIALDPPENTPVFVGNEVTYSISWANTSDTSQTVLIIDTLDPNVKFKNAYNNGIYNETDNTVTWNLGPQEAKTNGSVKLTVEVLDSAKAVGHIENTAKVQYGDNQAVDTNTVKHQVPNFKKELTQPENTDAVNVGDILEYSIQYKNYKETPVDIIITDKLDEGVNFEDASQPGKYSEEPYYDSVTHTVTWTLKNVGADEDGTVGLKVTVNEKAKLDDEKINNQASVQVGNDPEVSTNDTEISVPNDEKSVTNQPNSDGVYAPGDLVIYEINWKNYSKEPADITIIDYLDNHVKFKTATGSYEYDEVAKTVTWILKNQPAEGYGTITVIVEVLDSALEDGKITNQAGVKVGENSEIWTNVPENKVWSPEKSAVPENGKTVDNEDEIVYTISWKNYNEEETQITITDQLDPRLEYLPVITDGVTDFDSNTNTLKWEFSAEPNTDGFVSFRVQVNADDQTQDIQNTANVAVGDIPYTTNKVVHHINHPDPEPQPKQPVKKQVSPDPTKQEVLKVGEKIIYEITYYNYLDEPTKVTITDVLEESLDYVDSSDGGVYDEATRTVTWVLNNVAGLKEGKVTLTVRVNEKALEDTKVINNALVQVEDNPVQSTDDVETYVWSPVKTEISPGENEIVAEGTEIEYKIDWKNYKDEVANIVIQDTLDPGLDYIDEGSDGVSYDSETRTITWNLGNKNPKEHGTVSFKAKVNSQITEKVENQATVTVGGSVSETNIVSNKTWKPEKTMTTPKDSLTVGEEVTYNIGWMNYTSEPADITITDTLAAGFDFISAEPEGKYDPQTHTVTWNLSGVGAGISGSVSLTVRVNEKALTEDHITNTAEVQVGDEPKISTNPVESEIKPEEPKVDPVGEVLFEKSQRLSEGAEFSTVDRRVKAGDRISYQLTLENTRAESARNVIVTDPIPENMTLDTQSVKVNIPNVNVNQVYTYDPNTRELVFRLGDLATRNKVALTFDVIIGEHTTETWWLNHAYMTYDNIAEEEGFKPVNPVSEYLTTIPEEPTVLAAGLSSKNQSLNTHDSTALENVTNGAVVYHSKVAPSGNFKYTADIKTYAVSNQVLPNLQKQQATTGTGLTQGNLVVKRGEYLDYSLTVNNPTDATISGIQVRDAIPNGLVYVEGSASNNGVFQNNTVVWTISQLNPGEGITLRFRTTVPDQEVYYHWENTASLDWNGNTSGLQYSNTTIADTPVLERIKEQSTSGSKDVPRTQDYIEFVPGDVVTYYITVRNISNVPAHNVVITDIAPKGMRFIPESASKGVVIKDNVLIWTIEELLPGEKSTVEVSFSCELPEVVNDPIYFSNTAFVDWEENGNNNPRPSNETILGDPPKEDDPVTPEPETPTPETTNPSQPGNNNPNNNNNNNSNDVSHTTVTTTTTTTNSGTKQVGNSTTTSNPKTGVTASVPVTMYVVLILIAVGILGFVLYKGRKKE